MCAIEVMITKLVKKLEARWFANGENKEYNEKLRNLLDDMYSVDDCVVSDIMEFFESVFMGDDFDTNMIVNDFIKYRNLHNYSNFLNYYAEIIDCVNELSLEYK